MIAPQASPRSLLEVCNPIASQAVSALERENRGQKEVRVVFMIDQLTVLGGGERGMIQMIRALSRRFRCSVVTFRTNIHPEALARLNVPIQIFPLRRTFSFNGLRTAVALYRYLRGERPDIVHTFFETADLVGGLVAKLAKVRVLISSRRDMGILRARKHKWAYKLVGRMCHRVLTVADAVRDVVLRCDALDPRRVATLYTGVRVPETVPPEQLLVLRERWNIPEHAPIVLLVANILPWKGHREFLEAAALVRELHRGAFFIAAGACNDHELFQALLMRRLELGLENCFCYAGEVHPIAPLYQLASVACLLSSTEGLPNTVLEAMAAGRPVVAHRVGGTGELVVHGRTGFLVGKGDTVDAARRIAELLASPLLAQLMSLEARDRASAHFSVERMVQSLEGIYDACLAE